MTGEMHHDPQARGATAPGEAPRAFFRPKPDGKTDPAGEAGWYLERERERRGLSLQTASRATGVHPQHLRAIELGMLENLPAREEALRMIAAYARFLGFDPQPLVAHFENCLPQQQEKRPQAFSSARIIQFPLIERLRELSRTPAGMGAAVLTAVMLFGGIGWAVWPGSEPAPSTRMVAKAPSSQPSSQPARPAADTPDGAGRIAALPAEKAEASEPASGQGGDPIAALIARTVPQVADTAPTGPAPVASLQQPPAPVSPPAGAAEELPLPPPPDGGQAAPAVAPSPGPQATARAEPPLAPQPVRPLQQVPEKGIALRATEQIWLRLENDDGLPWFVGFLKAGDVLALPPGKALRLSASDVHRLEWYVNGQRMGRLGKRGADFLSEPLDGLYKQSGLKPPGGSAG